MAREAEEVHLTVFGVMQYPHPTPTNAKQKQTKKEDLQPNRKKKAFRFFFNPWWVTGGTQNLGHDD